jgi:hypothetical protein
VSPVNEESQGAWANPLKEKKIPIKVYNTTLNMELVLPAFSNKGLFLFINGAFKIKG